MLPVPLFKKEGEGLGSTRSARLLLPGPAWPRPAPGSRAARKGAGGEADRGGAGRGVARSLATAHPVTACKQSPPGGAPGLEGSRAARPAACLKARGAERYPLGRRAPEQRRAGGGGNGRGAAERRLRERRARRARRVRMDFQQLADVAEKWCSNTPFELIATEESERRMDFYADPGVSFYVLCPDNGCGDNFVSACGRDRSSARERGRAAATLPPSSRPLPRLWARGGGVGGGRNRSPPRTRQLRSPPGKPPGRARRCQRSGWGWWAAGRSALRIQGAELGRAISGTRPRGQCVMLGLEHLPGIPRRTSPAGGARTLRQDPQS